MLTFTHNETGERYKMLGVGIDTSKKSYKGSAVMIYYKEADENFIFVKDIAEFYEEFTAVERDDK